MTPALSDVIRRCMRRIVPALLLLAALGATAHAAPAPSSDVAELTRISNAWDEAIVRKDRAAIAANMRDDFRHIGGGGAIQGKAEFVDDLLSPNLQIEPYTVEEFDVRVYGNVALLSGRTHVHGTDEGNAFQVDYRYIDVYVREAGKWRVASVQITRVAE